MVELDKWIEKVKRCEYLAEEELKALCEYVSVIHVSLHVCNAKLTFARTIMRSCR